MLTERAQRLTSDITNLDRLRRGAKDAQTFKTRADLLSGPVDRLALLARIFEEFQRNEIALDFDGTQVLSLRTKAAEVARDFRESPESIIVGDPSLRFSFWTPLASLPDTLQQALKMAWMGHIDATLPETQTQLLETIERVPGFASQVQTIRQLYRDAEDLKRSLPQSPATFGRVKVIADDLRQAWRTLRGEGIPDEVLVFLGEASTVGVGLRQLTPTVREWLERNNLADSVRISLRSNSQ